MARKILAAAVVLVVLWFGYAAYTNWRKSHSMSNGEITSAEDAASRAVTSSSDNSSIAPSTPPVSTQPIVIQPSAPLTDSQQPNAINGSRFAGSGKYQVYRQGNITYRVDTETGQECVLLATDEEWRKPRVYERGCNSR